MTLEQFITKATLLVDEAKYPAGHKDRMAHDILIAGISNDTVYGKIIKKGPDITLTQVLEISCLEMATYQSLSQMSHTKLSISYIRYDRKIKTKAGPLSLHNKHLVNSMDLDHCLQTANQMPMENLPMQNSN